MALIQATRPKRRNYTIALFSTDPNSFVSILGTPWVADYFVNLNAIMTLEEQSRPYFVHFTLQSSADVSVGTPSTTQPVQIFFDFQNNTFPHLFSNSSYKPVGMLKFVPDFSTAPVSYGVEAKVNDNEEIYINSLLGVTSISFRAMTLDGAIFAPDARFSIYIHLVPADF